MSVKKEASGRRSVQVEVVVPGTNQDETPGPVAMACHTSSGVPGTTTST